MTDQRPPVRAILRSALAQAMRDQDREAISVCRTTLAAIDNLTRS